MSQKLQGKVAVVTGASKGIGAAIAKTLAAEGAQVVINFSRALSDAEKVVREIEATGGQAIALRADLSQPDEIDGLFRDAIAAFGRLDILVNNAGIYLTGSLGEITADHFHQQFNLNVLGLILATQAAIKVMPAEGGAIVNVSSVVSSLSPPTTAVYNATKSAVDGLTRTFAKELAPRNIRVNSINPGLIATEGTRDIGFVTEGQEVPAHLGRIGQPHHIAPGVLFLVSNDSVWMTGQSLYLTGTA